MKMESSKAPIEGWVDPISGLYPIDFAKETVAYELMAIKKSSEVGITRMD